MFVVEPNLSQSQSLTTMASLLTAKALPRIGERVRICGLKGATEHNGKYGHIDELADAKQKRYRVKLEGGGKDLAVRLGNITLVEAKPSRLHVLIPCHIDSDRRLATFLRCAKSVLRQTLVEFSIFVGLSGQEKYRRTAFEALDIHVQHHSARLYIQDDEVDQKPQMEHLRSLLLQGSIPVNKEALLTFVDNDDMCHPVRFHVMMDAYQSLSKVLSKPYTVAIPCKLILDPSILPEEGKYENFVNTREVTDFEYWKRQPFAARKVQLASDENVSALDALEYFDFIVPTSLMKKFFDLTPTALASHQFCDLRLFQILDYMAPIACSDTANPEMWLLAHYKVSMNEKKKAFDQNGRFDQNRLVHAVDQLSLNTTSTAGTGADQALAIKYGQLSAAQIGMCRSHLESCIIQYIGWNDAEFKQIQHEKIAELQDLYGPGFTNDLWKECHATILELLDAATLDASQRAWVKPRMLG